MEVPRVMLALAGKFPSDGAYADERLGAAPDNAEANLGRMPLCRTGGSSIGQSVAINYYIAAENNMLGSNNIEAAQILSLQEHLKEMLTSFRTLVAWGAEPTEEALEKWFEGGATDTTGTADRAGSGQRYLTWFAGRMNHCLGDNGFAVGDKLSLADVLIYNIFAETLQESEAKEGTPAFKREPFLCAARTTAFLEKNPKFKAICASVGNHPNMQRWLTERGVQGF